MHAALLLALGIAATATPALLPPTPGVGTSEDQSAPAAGADSPPRDEAGGVRLCSGAHWTGECWYGVYPFNDCIGLGGYTGNVLSFRPDDATECYLMQGRCNADEDFADFYHNSTGVDDLSTLQWIADAASYICFQPFPVR